MAFLTMAAPRQPVAMDGNGLACCRGFPADSICHWLPPVAAAGLHKGSTLCCLRWLRALSHAGEAWTHFPDRLAYRFVEVRRLL
jgi:hypothetical protein